MDRALDTEVVEGEIALVIDYEPGKAVATDVLQGAMRLIESIDGLDQVLLSSVDSTLEPVSILNDVQHSSLKLLLARALKHVPDDCLNGLEWKKWVGGLLVKGKHRLLQTIDADAPQIQRALNDLSADYKAAPSNLVGYTPPTVAEVKGALDKVAEARSLFPGQKVTVQTEYGDLPIVEVVAVPVLEAFRDPASSVTNRGEEYFKVKSVDMLGHSQWTVLRGNRSVRVNVLHQDWLTAYHQRKFAILPGDSLRCKFEETTFYDADHNELDRTLAIVEVLEVISPPQQMGFSLPER